MQGDQASESGDEEADPDNPLNRLSYRAQGILIGGLILVFGVIPGIAVLVSAVAALAGMSGTQAMLTAGALVLLAVIYWGSVVLVEDADHKAPGPDEIDEFLDE